MQRLMKPLRTCMVCDLQAYTEEDLESFVKEAGSTSRCLHGRRNICKYCNNERKKRRKAIDDRVYLSRKFKDMKQRCYNPRSVRYSYYGGRGIIICMDWLENPDSFIDWALEHGFQRDLQIDRIDNDGSYSPENCRFVTIQTQTRNMRNNVTDWDKGTRICYMCKEEKPLDAFHRSSRDSAGRTYLCRQCYSQKYRGVS